ncbi:sporulation membrane protein YtaF [Gorillibacterium sp. sgz5001074]|uniref:sporulation membrane protein YtaF n=1 Tax=Gorillibacterium sp. sgz5001074 TaxID=3446695 RepID=UPI003F669DFD
MPHLLSLSIMALALSLDGFGVGAMYGLRRIRIPAMSILIIALMSGLVFFSSMRIGSYVAAFFSPGLATMIGAVILMAIGCWAVYQVATQEKRQDEEDRAAAEKEQAPVPAEEPRVLTIQLKRLGLVIQILKTPAAADLDRSGTISSREAAWLGIALSLDAFGAGIGAALIGYPPVLTSVVIALSCGTFITLGLRVGLLYSNAKWVKRLSILPGFILILIGVMKLM